MLLRRSFFWSSIPLIVFFSLTSSLLAQVSIREKILISPSPPQEVIRLLDGTSGTGTTLRFVFDWTPGRILGRMIYYPPNAADQLIYGTGGRIEIREDAQEGHYAFNLQLRVAELGINENATATLSIFVNDSLVRADQTTMYGGTSDVFQYWIPSGFAWLPNTIASLVLAGLPDTLDFGQSTSFSIQGKNGLGEDLDPPRDDLVSFWVLTAENRPSTVAKLRYHDTESFMLMEVPYGDAHDGSVVLAATAQEPVVPQLVRVVAQLAGGEDAYDVKEVVIANRNRPPQITSMTLSPEREYFQLGSDVTVTAEATDPDGDEATLTYTPSQRITLNDLGPLTITVRATDSDGAFTERQESIMVVYVGMTPSVDHVQDGADITYAVIIRPSTVIASACQWQGAPADPAGGNNPEVTIEDPSALSMTVRNAKWYASPNDECAAKLSSRYTLTARVAIGTDLFELAGAMWVDVPDTGGVTPRPRLTGAAYAEEIRNKSDVVTGYRFQSQGTLLRVTGAPTYCVLPSSQFMPKVKAHEEIHIAQQQTGLAKDIVTVDSFCKTIRNLRAGTLDEWKALFRKAWTAYTLQERNRWCAINNTLELEAYAVSDLIAPRYVYQRCGHTFECK